MKFQIDNLDLAGCLLIHYGHHEDDRGSFVKTFNRDMFKGSPLETFSVEEEFVTRSKKDVIRGLHFQIPPKSHNKLVFCCDGFVADVLVDLRRGSPTYGNHCLIDLDAKIDRAIYIPSGIAHGFVSRADNSTLVYKVDCAYSPQHDCGISWDSCGIDWGVDNPILSSRDLKFPSFQEFKSMFNYA